jgi:hypothetical protein
MSQAHLIESTIVIRTRTQCPRIEKVNMPPTKSGGVALRLLAGLIGPAADHKI